MKKRVPIKYIDIIKDMYDGIVANVRTYGGIISNFSITIGLHQGSALSLFLFAIVMDELTRAIQDKIPWCMLFTDDIVLVDETRAGINVKLELWSETLESRGFKLSRVKTEYMECKFSKQGIRDYSIIRLDGQKILMSSHFKYLGSIIQKDGEINSEVNHKIQAGWLKWRSATGVLCDRNIPLWLKRKFYRTSIRPALLYGTEYWAIKRYHAQKISVAKMHMLLWMYDNMRRDKVRNENICTKINVASIEEKIRENYLRCFGHVPCRPTDALVRRVELIKLGQVKRAQGDQKNMDGGNTTGYRG